MTHVGTWFAGLEWLEATVRLRNLDIWRHVRIRPRKSRRFDSIRRQRLLELLSPNPLYLVLLSSLLISDFLLPLSISSIGWSHSVLHSLNCLFKQLLLLLLFSLELKSLTLEHRELRYGCEHLPRELGGSSFVLIDLLGDFQGTLSAVESLSSQFFSEVADFLVDELFLKK